MKYLSIVNICATGEFGLAIVGVYIWHAFGIWGGAIGLLGIPAGYYILNDAYGYS